MADQAPSVPVSRVPPPPGAYPYHLSLDQVLGADAMTAIRTAGTLTFHVLGDTGGVKSPQDQQIVAMTMATDLAAGGPGAPAFAYLLGDLIYYNGQRSEYYPQFYEPYSAYPAPILAVPGNHDGDPLDPSAEPSLAAFVDNFCATVPHVTSEAQEVQRDAMTQPNVYWTLLTPYLTLIGLYTNVPEGGRLDDQQAAWLESELSQAPAGAAVVVAMHHPIYSMDALRGGSAYMAGVLDAAIEGSGVTPHAVLSGHVHSYQRFTRVKDGVQIPYVVSGAGGYWHLHPMATDASGNALPLGQPWPVPTLPEVTLESYCDDRHGYLRLTATPSALHGEYVTVPRVQEPWRTGPVTTIDAFTVNLAARTVSTVDAAGNPFVDPRTQPPAS